MPIRYKGSIMSSTAATITTSSAKGIWRLNEVMQSLFAAIWPRFITPSVEYLVVAGGGAGGTYDAGGGGAGGLLANTVTALFSGAYTITIGAGGAAVTQNASVGRNGNPGIASSISGTGVSVSATGGGYGARFTQVGGTGGSGGGSGASNVVVTPTAASTATAGQGNIGGRGYRFNTPSRWLAGGGGGAGAAGTDASVATVGGPGGIGATSSITGTSTYYAGGGGGGGEGTTLAPAGGLGGGGAGVVASSTSTSGTNGTANTGGGGGGAAISAGTTSGAGGSGVVIIAYLNNYPDIASFSAGLVVNGVTTTGSNIPASDVASRSGYKVYRFTSGTGTVTF